MHQRIILMEGSTNQDSFILMSVRSVALNGTETSDIPMTCWCVCLHGHASHGCSGKGHFLKGKFCSVLHS